MPRALLTSSDGVHAPEFRQIVRTLITDGGRNEISRSHVYILCDAMREYKFWHRHRKIKEVMESLVLLGICIDNVRPCWLFQPNLKNLVPRSETSEYSRPHTLLSVSIVQAMHPGDVVYIMGGNCHALCEAGRSNPGVQVIDCLRSKILADELTLVSYSAGTTACGASIKHTRDKYDSLETHIPGSAYSSQGLALLGPWWDFAVHVELNNRAHRTWWQSFFERKPHLRFGSQTWIVPLANGSAAAFMKDAETCHAEFTQACNEEMRAKLGRWMNWFNDSVELASIVMQ